MWKPISETKYGIVLCSFDGSCVPHGLALTIGEAVQVFEECQGWFRGCLITRKNIWGIFPCSYIHLKECTSDVQGPHATVTPVEDPVAREVAYILREWAVHWKKIYLEGREPFDTLVEMMRDLVLLRRELLTHTLTLEQAEDLNAKAVRKIDLGNKRLSLDLVPRVHYEPVDAEKISPVQLYRLHEENYQNYTRLPVRRGGTTKTSEVGSGLRWKLATHHLVLNVQNFGCNVGEETEVHFRLFDAKDGQFFSEKFLTRMTKNGLPVNLDRINNNLALFTDLGGSDLLRDAYLVVHVFKLCSLREAAESGLIRRTKASCTKTHRRPYGAAAQPVNSILMSGTEHETEVTLKVFQASSEGDFHQLHENIIRKQPRYNNSTNSQPGIAVGLRMVHGDLDTIRKEEPTIFKDADLTRKIGFADVIMPGDVRNDLYVTLLSGAFEKGSKTAGKNVELRVCVNDKSGQPLWNCICAGAGEQLESFYKSTVFYHSNHPVWNDTIKLNVPIEFYLAPGSHIRIDVRHCSTKSDSKLFGFCFLPLVAANGTSLQDGVHELFLYKVDDVKKLSDPSKYLGLPNRLSQTREGATLPTSAHFKRSDREIVHVQTLLCSTKLTQNPSLLAVLRWQQDRTSLENTLYRLMQVDAYETIRHLQDILDALFSMFDTAGGARIQHSHLLFQTICHILSLVYESRYEQFRPVIDTYITQHFSAVLACRDLLICMTEVVERTVRVDDPANCHKCIKVIEYVMKFIVQSRKLYFRATVHSPEESMLGQVDSLVAALFAAMTELISIKFDTITQVQLSLLERLPRVFTCLQEAFEPAELCAHFQSIMAAVPRDHCEKVLHEKLCCLQATVNSPLFTPIQNQGVLVALCVEELCAMMGRRQETRLCSELLGDLLVRLHQLPQPQDEEGVAAQVLGYLLAGVTDPLVSLLLDKANKVALLKTHGYRDQNFSHLVASVVGLLRLLERHPPLYARLLHAFPDHQQQRAFLVRLLTLFERIMQDDVYPTDWVVMRHTQNQAILATLQFVAQTMLDDYNASTIDFHFELWEHYFNLAVQFVTQPSLQLERFSHAKQHKLTEKYGDMRVRMGYEILAMWGSLGVHKLHFVPALVGPLLEVTLTPETELRRFTLPIFYDMMQCEQSAYANFHQVEAEMIDKLDLLTNERRRGDEEYKQLFNSILLGRMERAPAEWAEQGRAFVQNVTQLLENLLDYRSVCESEENRGQKMTCTVNLLHFYKEKIKRQEMYVRYVHKLADLHLAAHNYTEAAFTLLLHATLLEWSERVVEDWQGDAPEWQRKEQLYRQIIAYFDTGKTWEFGISLCEELADFYKSKFLYKKLSDIRKLEASFYENILNELRPPVEYFRVAFYGQNFPLFLRNKEFVYRGQELEKLETFTQRLLGEHSDATLLKTQQPDAPQQHAKYVQVKHVTPVCDVDAALLQPHVPANVRRFYSANQVDTFTFDRAFHAPSRDDENEFKTMHIERTTLRTGSKLPGIQRWFEVVSTCTRTLAPIEVAIDVVHSKNEQIRELVAEYSSDFAERLPLNPLEMILQGTIDAAVQGGLRKYEETFFTEEFLRTQPAHQGHVAQLKALFVEQMQYQEEALKLHGSLMSSQMRPLHERLTQLFGSLKNSFRQSGSPSLSRLLSVKENLSQLTPHHSTTSSSLSSKSTPTDSNRSSGVYTAESHGQFSENLTLTPSGVIEGKALQRKPSTESPSLPASWVKEWQGRCVSSMESLTRSPPLVQPALPHGQSNGLEQGSKGCRASLTRAPSEPGLGNAPALSAAPSSRSLDDAKTGLGEFADAPPPPPRRRTSKFNESDTDRDTRTPPRRPPPKPAQAPLAGCGISPPTSTEPDQELHSKVSLSPQTPNPFPSLLNAVSPPPSSTAQVTRQPSKPNLKMPKIFTRSSRVSTSSPRDSSRFYVSGEPAPTPASAFVEEGGSAGETSSGRTAVHKTLSFSNAQSQPPPIPEKKARNLSESCALVSRAEDEYSTVPAQPPPLPARPGKPSPAAKRAVVQLPKPGHTHL